MRGRGRWIGSALLLVAVAFIALRPAGEPTDGTKTSPYATESSRRQVLGVVTRVIDGDTVEARLGETVEDVRLIGVDTPETVKPGAPVECFGRRASHFTKRRLEGRQVRLVLGVERRDDYGRLLAYVRVGGRLVNADLVRRGLAESLTIPPNDRLAPLFRRLELDAARAGRGLWGACLR